MPKSNVVLPEPEGPTKAAAPPASTHRLASDTRKPFWRDTCNPVACSAGSLALMLTHGPQDQGMSSPEDMHGSMGKRGLVLVILHSTHKVSATPTANQ